MALAHLKIGYRLMIHTSHRLHPMTYTITAWSAYPTVTRVAEYIRSKQPGSIFCPISLVFGDVPASAESFIENGKRSITIKANPRTRSKL